MSVAWAPTTVQVADYATSRTVAIDVPGTDAPSGDFTVSTYPTGAQVSRLIDGSCSWVLAGLDAALMSSDPDVVSSATTVAAIRTAGMIELTYPERDADIQTATALLAQADKMLVGLNSQNNQSAYQNAGSVNPMALVPIYSFPDPPWYGDRDL